MVFNQVSNGTVLGQPPQPYLEPLDILPWKGLDALAIFRKKPHVRNFSGAGNGCANFMGALHFLVLSAGKPHVLGGGHGFFW